MLFFLFRYTPYLAKLVMIDIRDPELAKTVRRCQRVLRMISELHKLGFQGLRIYPYQGAVGSWRVEIYPFSNFSGSKSLTLNNEPPFSGLDPARHTAASSDKYFLDWKDANSDNARQLATKFIKRFPKLCNISKIRDWEYAGWYQELMGYVEADNRLPCISWEYMEEEDWYQDSSGLPIKKFGSNGGFDFESEFPLPPLPRV